MDFGGKVWIPDNEHGFLLGTIVDIGSDTVSVELDCQKGKSKPAPYNRIFPAERDQNKDVEDNCALMFLNEGTLLNNLRIRYKKDKIYTYVANILLAVNPYHDVRDLYSKETIHKYHGKSLGTMPPHVFAIADKAYRDMRAYKQSQSIVVSGESGAGKTESTKYILRLINIFILLTVVVGGFISHYLLEKSRICKQSNGERNYHVFYRLCAAPKAVKDKLKIKTAEDYFYLKQGSIKDPSLDDVKDFNRMDQSMDNVGFSKEEKDNIYHVVSAVLHLGNIDFEEKDDAKGGCAVAGKSMDDLNTTAALLHVSSEELQMSLTTRMMSAGGADMRVPLTKEQTCQARDALAKALYTKLFDHIVNQVNQCFPFKSSATFIGVLDIAGFEYYELNSFEQFCINYCNEKLQQFFNDRILKQEQELYDREGLGVKSVKYMDNQDCIGLIESKKTGILDTLDEESKLPKPTAAHFTTEIHNKHKDHFRLTIPRKSPLMYHRKLRDDEGFLIRHFAGAVCYHTAQFIDKNNDALHSDLKELISDSKDSFIKSLFPSEFASDSQVIGNISISSGRQGSKKLAFDSVGNKFRKQLNQLMDKLNSTGASFIRCIKPNGKMTDNMFEGGSILSQLECAGMVSVLTLMQDGWPSRAPFHEVYNMYKSYLPAKLARLDPRLFCRALFHALGMSDKDYKFGSSKIFFRPGKFAEFDEVMKQDPENLKILVAKVQSWLIRTRWRRAIYGTFCVIRLAKKIKYRAQAIVNIQKSVRMFIALAKHKPRYKHIIKIRLLEVQVNNMAASASKLKKDKDLVLKHISGVNNDLAAAIKKIKATVMRRKDIEQEYFALVQKVNNQLNDLNKRQEQQKIAEEQERLRKIQEEMERERKRREEEERKRREEEEERKRKMEIELARQREEQERKRREEEERKQREKEEKDRQFQLEKQRLQEEEQKRQEMIEQERRDRELAMRLANEEEAVAAESEQYQQQPLQRNLPSKKDKKHDLSSWKYAELRDTINTSCDIELLEACKEEFHRRLKVYHQWRKNNKARVTSKEGAPQRAPKEVQEAADESAPPIPPRPARDGQPEPPSLPPRVLQRFFRVPFVKKTDVHRESEYKKQGWWFAHFDGQWIARQLEIHEGKEPLLLIAGQDDLDMCELSLDETGLIKRPRAQITQQEFETIWQRAGGKPGKYQAKFYQGAR
ncbi:unconventional myosin-VI [Exaiptasia diaphana]|uniref:Unconventional myosin-VI n=1 Tax=Exaiptasia diaphana TaxID=2652724 RepID=A0A913X8S3_EXADI|nr:unconventional myosin-VI [Exaiptasia diaphana]